MGNDTTVFKQYGLTEKTENHSLANTQATYFEQLFTYAFYKIKFK